ncbi:MAG TPA: hypothetical protein VF974_01115 [Patescibacteria group bacterium]
MNDFTQMHVFFFIASIAAIIVAVLLAVMISYFIKILRDINYISGKAKKEADLISEDLSELHEKVRAHGMKFRYIISFIRNIYRNHKK